MKRSILIVAFFASLFVLQAQKKSLGVTFGGSLDVSSKGVSVPTDMYFNPNIQVGFTGKMLIYDRLQLEASALYGIRQLTLDVPRIGTAPSYTDNSYFSSLALSPLIGVRLFEKGMHNLNIGVGVEPTVYFAHSPNYALIVKYKNRFDAPILARLTYGVAGIDIAVTYKHSFINKFSNFSDVKAQELMLSVYLPFFKEK